MEASHDFIEKYPELKKEKYVDKELERLKAEN